VSVQRASAAGSIVEILDRVLDKGIVIDASVRVALAGIEVLGVDARIVVASFETYLRHADAIAGTGLAAVPHYVPLEPEAAPAALPPTPDLQLPGTPAADPVPEP
jgi:gas vesicle structural protein